jgi:hypothetical protein
VGNRNPNPRRIKIHRNYSVHDAAEQLEITPNTVRDWLKRGLKPLGDGRPALIHGGELRAFLEARRTRGKRPCGPGRIYCVRCREPRTPADAAVELRPIAEISVDIVGRCSACGTEMHRRARRSELASILVGLSVRPTDA